MNKSQIPFTLLQTKCVLCRELHLDFKLSGNIKGGSLLDIASGPTIQSVISASEWFADITLSDFSETNMEELRKWLADDPGAIDSGPMFSYVSSLHPQGYVKSKNCNNLLSLGSY